MKTCVATEKQAGYVVATALQAVTTLGPVRGAIVTPAAQPVQKATVKKARRDVVVAPEPVLAAAPQAAFGGFSQPKQSVSQLVQTREGLATVLRSRVPAGTRCRLVNSTDNTISTVELTSPQGAVKSINYTDLINYLTFEEYVKGLPNIQRDPGADSAFFKTSLHQEYALAYQVSRHSSLRRMQQLTLNYLRAAFGANFQVSVDAETGKLLLTTENPVGQGGLSRMRLNEDFLTRLAGAISELGEEDLAPLLHANNGQLLRMFPAVNTATGAAIKPLSTREMAEIDAVAEATDLTETMKDSQLDEILKRAENFNKAKSHLKAYEDVNAYYDLIANVGRMQQALGLPVELLPKSSRSALASRAVQHVFKPYQMSLVPLEENAREAAVRVYACLHRTDFTCRVNQAKSATSRLVTAAAFARYMGMLHSLRVPEANAFVAAAPNAAANAEEPHEITQAEVDALRGRIEAAYNVFSQDELTVRVANAEED